LNPNAPFAVGLGKRGAVSRKVARLRSSKINKTKSRHLLVTTSSMVCHSTSQFYKYVLHTYR